MPLKRTRSVTTTTMPLAYQQSKKRRMPLAKRRKWSPQGTIGRPMPFPTRMLAKLKYCETTAIQSALVSCGVYYWSCNNIYDPNTSGGGHQPYGHDTYAQIYNQYTVIGARIRVCASNNTGVLFPITFGVGIEDDTSTSPTYDLWRERPTYKSQQLVINAGPEQKDIWNYWSRNKRFPNPDTAQSLSANFGASPQEQEFFAVVVQGPTSGTAIGAVYISVEIEYIVEMYELKDLGNS